CEYYCLIMILILKLVMFSIEFLKTRLTSSGPFICVYLREYKGFLKWKNLILDGDLEMGEKRGISIAVLAYTLWGLTPLYWALIDGIHPIEVVLIRTIMSFIFMIIIIPLFNHTGEFIKDLKYLKANKNKIFTVILAGFVISINWGLYVYGVISGHAFAFIIGLSFAFYSLIKSSLDIHALSSITLETLALLPFAIGGLIYMSMNYDLTIGYNSSTYWLLLSGAVTSIPLLLFSASAKNVP